MWLGHGAPSLSNLTAATLTRASGVPAVSNLLGSSDGAGLAQRLGASAQARAVGAWLLTALPRVACAALKTGRAVVVSCNLSADSPLLLARARRSRAQRLPQPPSSPPCARSQAVAEKYLARLLQAPRPA